MGATLDQVSDGRFWLGIGAGWFREEARMYGYEFPNAATRLGMLYLLDHIFGSSR